MAEVIGINNQNQDSKPRLKIEKMKKLITALCCTCALTLVANAQEPGAGKKPELTDEQKAVKKELTEKYDANKDGKLDKDERAKFSAEDKAKWDKAFPAKKEKEKEKDKDKEK
jgi:hypothetical protein